MLLKELHVGTFMRHGVSLWQYCIDNWISYQESLGDSCFELGCPLPSDRIGTVSLSAFTFRADSASHMSSDCRSHLAFVEGFPGLTRESKQTITHPEIFSSPHLGMVLFSTIVLISRIDSHCWSQRQTLLKALSVHFHGNYIQTCNQFHTLWRENCFTYKVCDNERVLEDVLSLDHCIQSDQWPTVNPCEQKQTAVVPREKINCFKNTAHMLLES